MNLLAAISDHYASGGPTTIAFDNFNRAAGALAGTSAVTGQVWSAGSTGGAASSITASGTVTPFCTGGNDYNCIDVGVADYTLTCTLTAFGTSFPGLAVRYVDFNNHLHLQVQNSTSYVLEKKVGGSFTAVQTISVSPTAGDILAITLLGSSVTVKINGTTQFSGTVTGISTSATKTGIGGPTAHTPATFDDFTVTA